MMHPIRRVAILVGVALLVAALASAVVGVLIHAMCAALVAVQP
jgi:hypothetical protein